MPTHYWGDKWEHWDDLYQAIDFILDYWYTRGRIGTRSCKEKYGTFRDDATFWDGTIHGLIHPGWFRYSYKTLFFYIDVFFIKKLFKYSGIKYLFTKYQHFIYNKGLQMAILKWPEIHDELCADLSYYELIKKGPGTKADGNDLLRMYWKVME